MQLEFRVISLVLLLFIGVSNQYVRCYQGPQGVVFTYRPETDFYEGQRFEFSCEAGTGKGTSYYEAIPSNKPESIYLTFSDDRQRFTKAGCDYYGDPAPEVKFQNGPSNLQWDPLTIEVCGDRDKKLDNIIITGNITQVMQSKYSNFSCEAYYSDGDAPINKNSANKLDSIPDLKEAPQNLTITLSSDVIKEGEQFNFSCESIGGKPESSFTYKIHRNSDSESSDLEEAFYVPTTQDREGFNISCTDMSHINYPGAKSNIIERIHVEPQYLEFNASFKDEPVKTVNVSSILTPTYNVSCDVFLSSSGLRHFWFFNGVAYGDSEYLTLNTSKLKNYDEIVCEARFESGHTKKTLSWLFTKPSSESADELPWIPLVAGSVALGAVVILAIILVLCCKRKQHRQNRTGNRELPRGNHSLKSKSCTQQGRRRTGVNALSPADQPNQMDATDIANQLLQRQYLHDQERQRLQDELKAKEQILNAAHQRGRELEIFRQQQQQKEAENAFQIDDNYTVFITDLTKDQPSKQKRVRKKLIN